MALDNTVDTSTGWDSPVAAATVRQPEQVAPQAQQDPNIQGPNPMQQTTSIGQAQSAPAKPPVNPDAQHTAVGKMYHSILSGLGGAQSETPVTDTDVKSPTYGQTKMVATPKTPGSQWRAILASAIAGLSAGAAQGYNQKKPFAGLSAGANAVSELQDKDNEANQQALKQKRQEFEDTQRSKLNQANILKTNAEHLNAFHQSVINQNSMDPHFAENQAQVDYLQKLPDGPNVVTLSTADAMKRMKDENYSHTHLMLGLGSQVKTDADGNPMKGPDGEFLTEGRVALIDGGHDGKFTLPPQVASDFQKYGKLGMLPDVDGWEAIKPDAEVDMKKYIVLQHELSEARSKEQQGWGEKTPGENAVQSPDGKTWLQRNPATNETRPYPGGVPQKVLETSAKTSNELAGVDEKKSATKKNNAEAAKADAETKKINTDAANGTATTDTLIGAAQNYQLDPEKMYGIRGKQRAEFMAAMLRQDPTWSESAYKARYNTVQDFTSKGKSGQQVESLNTFAGHVGEANQLISTLQNTKSPWLNKPMNKVKVGLGDATIGPVQTALEAAKDEYLNFLKAGHAPTKDEIERGETLVNPNSSPAQIQATLRQMARTVAIRTESLNHQYRSTMEKDYPDMLTPESAQVLKDFGIDISRVGGVSGQSPKNPQSEKQVPVGGQPILKNGQPVGYILNGQRVNF
jgi:hypothetical protein